MSWTHTDTPARSPGARWEWAIACTGIAGLTVAASISPAPDTTSYEASGREAIHAYDDAQTTPATITCERVHIDSLPASIGYVVADFTWDFPEQRILVNDLARVILPVNVTDLPALCPTDGQEDEILWMRER